MLNLDNCKVPEKYIFKFKISDLSNNIKLSLVNIEFSQKIELENYLYIKYGYFLKIENSYLYISVQPPIIFFRRRTLNVNRKY
jgi:hypothetical protein